MTPARETFGDFFLNQINADKEKGGSEGSYTGSFSLEESLEENMKNRVEM